MLSKTGSKKSSSFFKTSLFLILIIFIAVFFRFYKLGKVPISMSDDEIREVYTSYSVWKTGRDVFGHQFPVTFLLDGFSYAPVPIYLTAPFVGLLGLNDTAARLPYALAGIVSLVAAYVLIKTLTKNESIALISAFVLSISVWQIHVSRFAHEGIFPLMFYTIGTVLIFRSQVSSRWRPILGAVALFLGFYSYAAAKVIFIPLVITLLFFTRKTISGISQRWIIGISLVCLLSFVYLAKTQHAAEYAGGPFFFQNTEAAEVAVRNNLKKSHAPSWIQNIYINKWTYWAQIFWEKYLYAFSPQYLLTDQEIAGINSLWFRGQLYLIEAPFLIAGFVYLFQKKRKVFLVSISMLLISPLASGLGVNQPTYTHRSLFMLPWLALLIASGLWAVTVSIKGSVKRSLFIVCIAVIYILSVGRYFGQYYFEWSIYGAKYFSKSTKDAVLATRHQKSIIAAASDNLVMHYAYYFQIPPQNIQGKLTSLPFEINGVTFISGCLPHDIVKQQPTLLIDTQYIAPPSCQLDIAPKDSIGDNERNIVWNIYRNL